MSSLPPYSTYRTDNKQMMYPQAISHGNVLTFTPPGFKQELNVKFPDCRLAVCEKCKKNYKTRDMCRVRNSHTASPWTTAFICITLDDTCTDSEGKYIDKPLTVRMVQWQPFCVKTPFDSKTPVCSACKKTNRTRSFCRERHKHRQLPWCTVYVLLSALDSADPSTVVAAPSKPVPGDNAIEDKAEENPEEKKSESPGEEKSPDESGVPKDGDVTTDAKANSPDAAPGNVDTGATEKQPKTDATEAQDPPKTETPKQNGGSEEGDNINDIAESRTFLAKVSCRSNTVHWLELAEFDGGDSNTVHGLVAPDTHMQALNTMRPGAPGVAIQAMDPQQAQYYAQAMGYAAQQHQHALKSHQQYFFQMQQRQQHQYAAQAAWQAQYNQPGMQGQAPGPAAAPVSSGVNGQPAQASVTAGEAAAQQQKQGQNSAAAPPLAVPQQPPVQQQPGQEQTAGAAAAAAQQQQQQQQQQQANPQWQAQMMYQQHLYQQQQLQMQQQQQEAQAAPQQQQVDPTQQQQQQQPPQQQYAQDTQQPQQQQYASQEASMAQGPSSMPQVPPGGEMGGSRAVDTVAATGEEHDAKRTRYV